MKKLSGNIAYFNLSVDCEATQPAIGDAKLGNRAVLGIAEVLEHNGWRGTFFAIPTDARANASTFRELERRGHEIGLHLHPAAQGYAEFCGIYGPDMQKKIISEAIECFADAIGRKPVSFSMGYGSANDFTYGVLANFRFSHGICSIPGRILPECASVWAGAPLFIHYAHAFNRLLPGELDFVEMPITVDWESRMWAGKHPQDLRVELVDAKNHYYTIEKSLKRQVEEKVPVKFIHAFTHNTFEYGNRNDFRRQTLEGILQHFRSIAIEMELKPVGKTLAAIADVYRSSVKRKTVVLALDRRGYKRKSAHR